MEYDQWNRRMLNAALEEIVMVPDQKRFFDPQVILRRRKRRASRLLSQITGVQVQPNKAIVGANAFAHESGIINMVFSIRSTDEIMTPESVGLSQIRWFLKTSGRHALRKE